MQSGHAMRLTRPGAQLVAQANYQITPGHEIVARVRALGASVTQFAVGDRVGMPWLARNWRSPRAAAYAPSPVPAIGIRRISRGHVVCAGIHMSDIPSFPYHLLWGERTVCSVANLTRADGLAFMDAVPPC